MKELLSGSGSGSGMHAWIALVLGAHDIWIFNVYFSFAATTTTLFDRKINHFMD